MISLSFVKIILAFWWRIGLRECLSHFSFAVIKHHGQGNLTKMFKGLNGLPVVEVRGEDGRAGPQRWVA